MKRPLLIELNYVLKSLVDYNLLKIDNETFYKYFNAVNNQDIPSAVNLVSRSNFQSWSYKLSTVDFKYCDPVVKSDLEHTLVDRNHYWNLLSNFFPELSDKIYWIRKFVEDHDDQAMLVFLKSMNKHPDVENLLRAILDKDLDAGLAWLKTEFPLDQTFKLVDHLMKSFEDVDWREILKESRLRYTFKLAEKLNKVGAELGETWVINDQTGLDAWLLTMAINPESILNMSSMITDPVATKICQQTMFGNKKFNILQEETMSCDYTLGPDTIINLNCVKEDFETWQDLIRRGTLLVLKAESNPESKFSLVEKLKASDIVYHEAVEDLGLVNETVIAVK